jgi:hypothetical protein
MKRFKKMIVGFSLMVPCYSVALDLVKSEKPFTGLYFGGRLGGSMLAGDFNYQNATDKGTVGFNGYGITFGGMLGYMFLTDSKLLFGGEIYLEQKTSSSDGLMNNTTNLGNITLKSSQSIGAVGIAGTAVSPRLVTYVKGGYEKVDFVFDYSNLTTVPNTGKITKPVNLFVTGMGGFYKLSGKLVIGADYTIMLSSTAITPDTGDLKTSYKPDEQRGCITVRFLF